MSRVYILKMEGHARSFQKIIYSDENFRKYVTNILKKIKE
jgi:hypothetical protein